MSVANDLADALVASLTTIDLSDAVVERRATPIRIQVEAESTQMKLLVMPKKQLIDLDAGTRNESLDTHTLLLGIFKKMGRGDDGLVLASDMEAMSDVVEQVTDHMKSNRSIGDGAQLQSIEQASTYDTEMLEALDLYVTAFELNYRLYR